MIIIFLPGGVSPNHVLCQVLHGMMHISVLILSDHGMFDLSIYNRFAVEIVRYYTWYCTFVTARIVVRRARYYMYCTFLALPCFLTVLYVIVIIIVLDSIAAVVFRSVVSVVPAVLVSVFCDLQSVVPSVLPEHFYMFVPIYKPRHARSCLPRLPTEHGANLPISVICRVNDG